MTRAGRGVLVAAALAWSGCDAGDARPGDTSTVGAELLGAAAEEERRASAGSPSGSGAVGSGTPQQVDVTTLGYDSGDPDAPVQVIEFSDFGCGYCRKFHLETWPTLEERYVQSGKIRWKYVPMILGIFGPNADVAAEAGECAMEQGAFPAVQTRLFRDQGEWKRSSDAESVLRALVADEGVDTGRWNRCMAEDRRRERVAQGTALSRQLGVRGTPTFFVVGYGSIPGAIPVETFVEVLDTVWADATRAGGSGG